MLKENNDASIIVSSSVTLSLHLKRQLTPAETLALVSHLRRKLPLNTLHISEEQSVRQGVKELLEARQRERVR